MNNIITNGYAKLLQRGRISINDIPSEYIDNVKKYMNEKPKNTVESKSTDELPTVDNGKIGAICIPDVRDYEIEVNTSDDKLISEFVIPIDVILPTELFAVAPCNPEFKIFNIENIYGRINPGLQVTIYEIKGNLKIKVWGTVNTFASGDPLFRLDLQITSDNYEDMSVSIFFVAK